MSETRDSSVPSFADAVSAVQARAEATGRALVVIPSAETPSPFDHLHGLGASFLAHLIAMANRSPQTTVLRRASPDEAVASYETVQHRDDTGQPPHHSHVA
jgi:hypothetical protein